MKQQEARSDVSGGRTAFSATIAETLRGIISHETKEAWTLQSMPTQGAAAEHTKPEVAVCVSTTGPSEGKLFLTLVQYSPEVLKTFERGGSEGPAQAWLSAVNAAQSNLDQVFKRATGLGVRDCQSVPLAEEGTSTQSFLLQSTSGEQLGFAVAFDTALEERLADFSQVGQGSDNSRSESARGTVHIERVLDVPLSVTLRFGQRHLTLREVLALDTGALVELDRQVEEPVDLVLGDRIIARGEVVVVDGNYGLRVTEVVEGATHRLQRLHTAMARDEHSSGAAIA